MDQNEVIYVNGDGIWLRCNCQNVRGPKLIAGKQHMTITMVELKQIVKEHGHH